MTKRNNLAHISTFQGLNEEDLKLLTSLFEQFSCGAGTVVIEQGAPAEYLYFIEKGKVAISYKPYDDHAITVTHVEKGGLFGWSAVVGSKTYTSSGTAIGNLQAVRIRGSELRKLCVDHPDAGRKILDHLASSVSARWKDAHEQVKAILKNGIHGE